ncbi:MAG: DUF4270 domain-containing protein [Chitinophagaceae bacterium]|nr:DUF4270 domain-containing protein [Chitinophagaceae bacterium]
MKRRQLAFTIGALVTGLVIILNSCKKINESTELGGDLIPPIDNINTFDTTLSVEAYNDLFTLGGTDPLKEDSLRSNYADEQFLGRIDNDIFFGKTEAEMYFELKPEFYPFTFRNRPDSIYFDSVVLVLDYVETYGDSMAAQTLSVSEITSNFRVDTSYIIRKNSDITTGASLAAPATIIPAGLDDSVKVFLDTTKSQLRIRLDDAFGQKLLNTFDTSSANGKLNAYSTDSAFKSYFKGFAIKSTVAGNALMGFNLQGENTKLAIYYRHRHGKPDLDLDTTVDYFRFRASSSFGLTGSAAHNYIKRDYAGYPIAAAQGGTSPDPVIYLQNTPGSFATVKIPGLAALNNRIIHRAELIAEQVYDPSDATFTPPNYLFLDAYVPAISKYMTIPFDLAYDGSGDLNLGSFGIAPVNKLDGSANVVKSWRFNISRWVQHIVNDTEPTVYDLRLYAPFIVSDQYRPPVIGSTPSATQFGINPTIAKGRVRIAGNLGPADTNPQKMRLRIVYSKL